MVVRGGSIINIAGTTPVDDPEYRYKMPAVFGKVEGSGNGIKTAIPNISDVGLSLHRNPAEVNKFFGTELGAQTRYNPETDRAIVNGAHTDAVLQELTHKYIEKFVLCPNCRLPETEYKIKSGTIYHRCKACGAKELVDMSHKLVNFILAEDKKTKKTKKGSESSKKSKKKKDDSDEDKKKAKKEKKKNKKDKKSKSGGGGGDDYIQDALTGGGKPSDGLDDGSDDSVEDAAGVDDAGALKLAVEAVQEWKQSNPEASIDALVDQITNQQMASALKSPDKIHILVQSVFTSLIFKNDEIATFAPAIAKLTNQNRIMERHLIGAAECFCETTPKNFAVFLKQLYDSDALEEEAILEWSGEGRSEFTRVDEDARAVLRAEAEPLVVWLQEAESDEESDESE